MKESFGKKVFERKEQNNKTTEQREKDNKLAELFQKSVLDEEFKKGNINEKEKQVIENALNSENLYLETLAKDSITKLSLSNLYKDIKNNNSLEKKHKEFALKMEKENKKNFDEIIQKIDSYYNQEQNNIIGYDPDGEVLDILEK